MTKKVIVLVVFLVMIVSLGLLANETKRQSSDDKDRNFLSEKIEEVLRNQQDIIERLKDIRVELDVIRVRASR